MAIDEDDEKSHSDVTLMDAVGDETEVSSGDDREVLRGRARRTALPHRYHERGLEWTIESCVRDDGDEIAVEGAGAGFFISLLAERDWSAVTIAGTIAVPEDVYEDVVPDVERAEVDEPPTRLDITVESSHAILRDARVVAKPAGSGEHEFEIRLDADRLYGKVTLTPVLARRKDCPVETRWCASGLGHRLAEAAPCTIEVDLTEELTGLFVPERQKFSEDDDFPPEDHLVHLVLEGEDAPQLFLNDDHERLLDVLDVRASYGKDASFRDVTFDLIEAELWPQLIFETASSVDSTGEPESDWQWDVLREVAEPLYGPGVGPQEAGQRLRRTLESPDELSMLQRKIEDFVQSRVGAPDHLKDLYDWLR